jgi:serine/threonine-protein kinase HipA
VLGVSDEARLGALRFVEAGRHLSPAPEVPPLVRLGALLDAANRVARDEETSEDLALILAPGSSLGGARPKASVLDQHGNLSIAKFPRETDEYRVELWEWVALELARRAGIRVAESTLLDVGGRSVLLSRRFDRRGRDRIHFASALTLLGLSDGDQASYPEIAEILQREGSAPRRDSEELSSSGSRGHSPEDPHDPCHPGRRDGKPRCRARILAVLPPRRCVSRTVAPPLGSCRVTLARGSPSVRRRSGS